MRFRDRRAFTLIELLLAIGMVAMLMLSLYVGMSTAFRARRSVSAQTDVMRQAKAALDLIEQDLRSVLPPGGTLAGPFLGTLAGTVATIDCYSLGADYATLGQPASDGMRHVLLMTYEEGAGHTLVRYVTRDLLGTAGGSPEEEILARDVSTFTVRFYDGTTWTDTWDSTILSNALPLAAEVNIGIKRPSVDDPERVYTLSRLITLPCGLTPDQAAAVQAAASANTTGTPTDSTGTGATGTGAATPAGGGR